MSGIWIWFALAGMTGCGMNGLPVPSPPIKVMSFNIRFGTAEDGENHWDHRHPLLLETIEVSGPDLLGVQESLSFQGEYLQSELPEYGFVGRGREKEADQGEFCGIFFRKSRFTKIDEGHFWLSATPDEPGSCSWDSSLPRMVSWVRLRDRQGSGCEFLFANTHFDHVGEMARVESAKLIRTRLVEAWPDTPLILTGDFNAAIGSRPNQILLDKGGLRDSYAEIHPDPEVGTGTFGGWTGRRTGARIDWILHGRQWRTLDARINYFQDGGRFPSDHYPVEAVLRWQGGAVDLAAGEGDQ